MHWAHRFRHGPDLEEALARELRDLSNKHRQGFVIRLHVLGDFYSEDYVEQWGRWLAAFPRLRVFGYTAHDPHDGGIGERLNRLSLTYWYRFAIRFSMSGLTERATGPDGIICPAQTGKTDCCATCGLCWNTRRNIQFLEH